MQLNSNQDGLTNNMLINVGRDSDYKVISFDRVNKTFSTYIDNARYSFYQSSNDIAYCIDIGDYLLAAQVNSYGYIYKKDGSASSVDISNSDYFYGFKSRNIYGKEWYV